VQPSAGARATERIDMNQDGFWMDPMDNRILVVSGDGQFRRAVEVALVAQGHAVSLASASVEALEVARTTRPQLLVTDLGGDESEDGWSLARRLRREMPRMRCLLVHPPHVEELPEPESDPDLEAGWVCRFPRPFSMVQFAAAADQAMRRVATESAATRVGDRG
jgi:DNA-binding response OmpR family regulator